jgi:hypothetical protein
VETADQQAIRGESKQGDPWRSNEEARRRRLRQDGRRSLSENLAEGLALSEFLSTFTGSALEAAQGDGGPPPPA